MFFMKIPQILRESTGFFVCFLRYSFSEVHVIKGITEVFRLMFFLRGTILIA